MSTIVPSRESSVVRTPLQRLAIGSAAAMAALYGLLFLGVLDVGQATDAERGILGVAAAVFGLLAGLLWWRRSRLLWTFAAALQLLLGWMYLAIAPERDPSFELWGVTIRLVSLVLLVAVVGLIVADRRARRS